MAIPRATLGTILLMSSYGSPSSFLGGCSSSRSSLKLLVTVFAVWVLGRVLIQLTTVGLQVSTVCPRGVWKIVG